MTKIFSLFSFLKFSEKTILAPIFTLFASFLFALNFSACAKDDDPNKVYEAKFTHVSNASTPKGKAADLFAKRVGELSEGRIVVHVFPSAQLVDDDKIFVELKRNNVQFSSPNLSKFVPIAKEFNLWDMPFLFRSPEHAHRVMDGEIGTELKEIIAKKGFVLFDFWDNGFRQLSTNKNELILPKDIAGQKFRINTSKVIEEQFRAVQAIPQVINFGEVYSALQQGVVDGSENALSNFYYSKFYEVQKFLTISNHSYSGYLVIGSEKFMKSLPDDLKEVIYTAMAEATKFERELTAQNEANLLQKIKDDKSIKTKIYELNEEEKRAWQEAMKPVYAHFSNMVSPELIQRVIDTE